MGHSIARFCFGNLSGQSLDVGLRLGQLLGQVPGNFAPAGRSLSSSSAKPLSLSLNLLLKLIQAFLQANLLTCAGALPLPAEFPMSRAQLGLLLYPGLGEAEAISRVALAFVLPGLLDLFLWPEMSPRKKFETSYAAGALLDGAL